MDIDSEGSLRPMEGVQPIRIFYCYAREDKRYRDMLENYLSTMKRSTWVSSWHDSMINAGEDWERKIDEQIKAANVILLLISPDFMHSNYCYGVEMKRALERHEAKKARVIPIILRPTDWEDAPFARLQVLPTNAKPLTRWQDRDEAFLNIAKGIRKSVRELLILQKTASQWIEEGEQFIHLGRYEDALAAFDHATELAPYDAMAYASKGAALEHLHRFEEALKFYEQAITIASGSVHLAGEDSRDFLLQQLSVSHGIDTRAYLAFFYSSKGRILLLLRRFEEGLACYNQAIDLGEDDVLYYERATILINLQRYEEAISDFERAIDLDPNDESASLYYAYKGFALASLGRLEDALSACEQALVLDLDNLFALATKGLILGKLDRFEEALVAFEQAIQLDPNSIEAYYGKADCLYHLEDYEASLAAYQKVVKLDANNYHALCGIGETLSALNRDKEAVKAFDAAIHVDPNNTFAYKRKANILADLGHDFESQVILSRVNHITSGHDNEEDDPFSDTNEPEKLLASCEEVIRNDPENLTALVNKCIALSRLNRPQEAYDLYTDLLQKYPNLERGVQGPSLKFVHLILMIRLKMHNNSMAEQIDETHAIPNELVEELIVEAEAKIFRNRTGSPEDPAKPARGRAKQAAKRKK